MKPIQIVISILLTVCPAMLNGQTLPKADTLSRPVTVVPDSEAVSTSAFSGLICALPDFPARAHSFLIGAGPANILDTYLSPYNYKGVNIHAMRHTERRVAYGRCLFQTQLDVDGSILENPGGNVNEYAGGVRYAVGWLKPIWYMPHPILNGRADINLFFGPMLSGYLGCLYNERNGNNPAQAKADLMIDLSVKADLSFRFLRRDCSLSYQLNVPVIGMAFSPNYGQSYYEAFEQDNYDHNLVFAHPGNMPSLRQNLIFGIKLRKSTSTQLLIGYSGYLMQSKFNNLRYHSYTHTFLVGFKQHFQLL